MEDFFNALCQAERVHAHTETWKSKSISVLYAYDEQFRSRLGTSMKLIKETEHKVVKLDVQNKYIRVPDSEHLR